MRNQPDPTQPLPNPRHEAFVQALLRGENQDAAYASAGFRASRPNASRLRTNDNIVARLAELQRVVAERVIDECTVTVADVVKELARIGFSDIKHCAHVRTVEDLKALPDAHSAAVQEMTTEEYLEGRGEDAKLVKKTRIKLHGKEPALVKIGKHLGMFGKDKAPAPSDAELVPQRPSEERLAEMRKRYAPRPH